MPFSPAATFRYNSVRVAELKSRLMTWASGMHPVTILQSNEYHADAYGLYDCLIAAGCNEVISIRRAKSRQELESAFQRLKTGKNWWFGYISYDLKNAFHNLISSNEDYIEFPDLYFFEPQVVIAFAGEHIRVYGDLSAVKSVLEAHEIETPIKLNEDIVFQSRLSKHQYLETVKQIKKDIYNGEVYELNYCQEYFAYPGKIDPFQLFLTQNERARMPFSVYFHAASNHIMSCSPERFVRQKGGEIVSQPIKGTAKKGLNEAQTKRSKAALFASEKDRAENVMIVDLVRNDLAKICETGSVHVPELFGIYEFESILQMISTVKGTLKEKASLFEIFQALFPMGSMTGAPKIRAMQLIDDYESFRRGPYSGSVGYIDPQGNFDFNVLIRTLFYNEEKNYLSYPVGGAIVYDSDPENEYQECLLKAQAILLRS